MKKIFQLCICLLMPFISQAQIKLIEEIKPNTSDVNIPYTRYQLPNGLTVILHEDHSDPIVHVDVTYHVGSAREEIGKSGFAHFFEHMMFQGSDNVGDEQHFKIITEAGGTLNGTTNRDRTNYFETVPANQLEKMLWLESDRMGFLLDAVTQKKFEVQRATVKNERGQNYDNRPYGLAGEVSAKNLYPYGHPYSWLTIGYIEDLDRVNVNDLKNFFLRWYGPNNAVLTIGGDIDKKQTLQWVEKYFGAIPQGPKVEPVKLPLPTIDKDRYATLVDNYAKIPMLVLSFPGVHFYHADEPALDCLADILGGGKSSILYKQLVKSQKALSASAFNPASELGGEFTIRIMPKPGTSLADMEKEVRKALDDLAKNGIDEKAVDKFRKSQESNMIYSLESVSGKVSQLASYFTFTGNPNYFQKDIARYSNITKADVDRVFKKYVANKPMVILSVVPKGNEDKIAAEPNYTVDTSNYKAPNYGYNNLVYKKAKDNFDRSKQPAAAKSVVVKMPKMKSEISNSGLHKVKIISSYFNEIPTITVQISTKGGYMMEQNNLKKVGVASMFSSMMGESTDNYTAGAFADALEKMGSSISVSTGLDRNYITLQCLAKNLAPTLKLLEERLYHSVFNQDDFDRIKNQRMESFKNNKTVARAVASNGFDKACYGTDNIYGIGSSGDENTLANITLNDVKDYYNSYFGADDLQMVLVGDFSEQNKKDILASLQKLKSVQIAKVNLPAPQLRDRDAKTAYVCNIPKAAQTEFRVGYVTDLKYDALGDYYKAGLMNYPLGGAFNSRLNLNLREDKGWTYGARSGFDGDDYTGTYLFSSGIKADQTCQALREIMREIEEFYKTGIKDDEISFLKNAISQSEARKYETSFQKLAVLSNIIRKNLPEDYVTQQNAILQKINKAEINEIAKKWLDPSKMKVVLAGDLDLFRDLLQSMGYEIVELDAYGNVKN